MMASTSAITINRVDIAKYFQVAKEITLKAGKLITDNFESRKIVETKDVNWNLVTNYDCKIQEILINYLSKEFPDHKFIAEETIAEDKSTMELTDAPTWIIDPIDGTTNFVHSFSHVCISVALAVYKQVVIGIVYNPIHLELYTAIKGEGSFLNGKPIRTSKVTELEKSLSSFEIKMIAESIKKKDIFLGRLIAITNISQGVRNIGSAALAMSYVASGKLDCFQMDGLRPWDVAAAMLIIQEAGGTVIDTKGGPYNIMEPNTIATSTNELAQELTALLVATDLKTQRKRLQRS